MDLGGARKELSRVVAYMQMVFKQHGDPDDDDYDPQLVISAARAIVQAMHPLVKVIELADIEERLAEVERILEARK